MRTSIAPEDTSAESSAPWLEVRRGRTRAPRRDINGRRFLIGAGSNCQLQLGGADMPILHSILLIEEDGAHIDAVVPSPQLMVNGRPQRSVDLQDGDVFNIGKFEFQVHVPHPHAAIQAAPRAELPIPQTATELEHLSATELVALIEAEQQQADDLETARLNGARALLDAAQRAAASAAVDAGSSGEFVLSFPQPAVAATNVEQPATEDAVAQAARRAS